MTLAGRIKRLEAQRAVAGSGVGSVAFELDAKGELIGARVTRWDGARFPLGRAPGETVDAFGLRAAVVAGDLVTLQAYVLSGLQKAHRSTRY